MFRLRQAALLEVLNCLFDFGARVHDEGAVAGNGFVQWPGSDEYEPCAFFAGLQANAIARAEFGQCVWC